LAEFSVIPMHEAQVLTMPPRRALQEQYRQYVRQLTPDEAGRLDLQEGDRSITERARLKAAAKTEGVRLEIQRQDGAILFWLLPEELRAPEAPKAPEKRAARRKATR
jgi:hypothetical protein